MRTQITYFTSALCFSAILAFTGCSESSDSSTTANTTPEADTATETDTTASETDTTAPEADTTAPATTNPTACVDSAEPPTGCRCSTEEGFTTYTFEHQGQQRCLTVYVNEENTGTALPLVIQPDCYTANDLQEGNSTQEAKYYGFHYMDLTSPDGGWDFPNNNEINESNYATQCDDSASKDMGYLKGVFTVVDQLVADGLVDPDKVYIQGFSQNSMFSIFMATCFPDRIAGIAQGGSGLYSEDDGSFPLPKCEGACTADAFAQYDIACLQESPCTTCKYFPVFPEKTGAAIKSCLFMYDNDNAAHSTAVPGFNILKAQGHNPTLAIFAADPQNKLGGHSFQVNQWAWTTSCLGMNEPCSAGCGTEIGSCMEAFKQNFKDPDGNAFDFGNSMHRNIAVDRYYGCLGENTDVCEQGCAATRDMLTLFETPSCECDANTESCDCQTSDIPGGCQ